MIDLIQEDQQGTELLRSVVQDEMSSGQELLEAHRLLNGAKAAASRSLSKREGGQIRYDAHTSKKETGAKLSQADLDRARETEIQRFYEVNGRGFASSPFHQERTPSMHVTQNMFSCFSCYEHGDSVTFIVKVNRMTFPAAVQWLLQYSF